MALSNERKIKAILVALFFSVLVRFAYAEELADPLKGIPISKLLADGGDVFLIKIKEIKLASQNNFCRYSYSASVINVYRSNKGEILKKRNAQIEFSSGSRLQIDGLFLVIKNHRSDRLNPKFQDSCMRQIYKKKSERSFLIRQDEVVKIYESGDKYFAFLPYRRLSHHGQKVLTREIKYVGNDEYLTLDISDEPLDGEFFLLDDLLKPLTQPDKR